MDLGEAVEPLAEVLPEEIEAAVAMEQPVTETVQPATEAAQPAAEEAPAAAAAPALRFLDAPQGDVDDLKQISGVGPVLETKLNELGIYHYSQIAAFTPEEIERVDTELNFKGRIEREGWIDQAKTLAQGGGA